MSAVEKDLDSEISRALLSRKDEIVKGLVESAISQLSGSLGYRAGNLAVEMVDKFMKEDVMPEVQKHLEAHKAQVIARLLGGIDEALDSAGKRLVETAAKNLGSSWNMKKVVEGMFG